MTETGAVMTRWRRALLQPERAEPRRRVRPWTLVALALLPVLVVGLLLGASWGRTSRLSRINAAVVNSDRAVTVNGKVLPLGRQLAAEIVSKQPTNISWTLSEPADAASGLASGKYAVVVTIPENFSAAATSPATPSTATQATIQVQTSAASPVQDAEIARQVADLATQSTNAQITGLYLDNVYIGFNKLSASLTSVATGAGQLAAGASRLASGAGAATKGAARLAAGLNALDDSASTLAGGGTTLAAGATRVASGASQLATGVGTYTTGAAQVATGARQLSDGVATYTSGAAGVADGVTQLDRGVTAYTSGTAQLVDTLTQVNDSVQQATSALQAALAGVGPGQVQRLAGMKSAVDQLASDAQAQASGLQAYHDGLVTTAGPWAGRDAVTAARQAAGTCVSSLTARGVDAALATTACSQAVTDGTRIGAASAASGLTARNASGRSLIGGAQHVATGTRTLATGVDAAASTLPKDLPAQQAAARNAVTSLARASATLAARAQALKSGGTALATGSHQLASRSQQLKSGGRTLARGASTLASRSSALVQGGAQLRQGASRLSAGASALSTGVDRYTAGVSAQGAGIRQAHAGANTLASGLSELTTGAQTLAQGTSAFAAQVAQGARTVPTYSPAERQKLSTVVSTPVTGGADSLGSTTRQQASLLLVLAAWVGSMAIWLIVRPVSSRTLVSSAPSWRLAAESMLPALLVSLVQGIALGLLGCAVLRPGPGGGVELVALLVLASVAFTAVNHALAAWLGGAGRVIGVVLAAITAAVGTVSAVPGVFHAVHRVSPLAPALTGVRAISAHQSPGVGSVLVLVALLVVSTAWAVLAVVRRRQMSAAAYRQAARVPDAGEVPERVDVPAPAVEGALAADV